MIWFNDVWCYDATTNKWMQLDCIGYIPAPREGHAAALVDDVMYVFGGRTEEGNDLGDLAAFRIPTRRWYTFQNMGPSPSARSGHSMTTVGKSIVTFGGEPSSATSSAHDLGLVYVLDTTKIRYPTDAQQNAQRLPQGHARRPSVTEAINGSRPPSARDGSNGPPEQRRVLGGPGNTNSPTNGHRSPPPVSMEGSMQGSKLPRAAGAAGPSPGPPPQGPVPMRPGADPGTMGRARGPSADRAGPASSPQIGSSQHSPITRDASGELDPPVGFAVVNGRNTPTQTQPQPAQAPRAGSKQESTNLDGTRANFGRPDRGKGSVDSSSESALKAPTQRPASPPPPSRPLSNAISRRSSGRNSQTVVLLKELDSARNRNAWYASELELAKKAGYVSTSTSAAALEGKSAETFDDDDRPLVEALLAMRNELATVQGAVDKQASLASRQIAEVERQRDAAIQEALYAKAKLVAQQGGTNAERGYDESDASFRVDEMSRKLASALHLQKALQSQLDQTKTDLDNEKKARKLADDTSTAAQRRMTDLESYKQQTSAEVERLKAELHMAQREAREHSVASTEAIAALELLKAEKGEIAQKYEEALGTSKTHTGTFESLRVAIAASEDGKAHLQTKLDEERAEKEKLEAKLSQLKTEHEASTAELVATTQRLRDAEELSEKHANEAKTHREAVMAGLDKMTLRDDSSSSKADNDRVAALQNQVAASNSLVKKYQQEADSTAEKLRSAEERIAGLEQYQEQSSREGVGIRRQLQSAMRDTQALQANNTDLKNQLAAQQLETNAMTVQHTALKNILSERGISPTASAVRVRGLNNSRTNSPDLSRTRDLESQLASANAAHEETKQAFAIQQQESETMYREKLSQLENDYRSAVHYVKGTEQMLKQLKEQLSRYKAENSQLKSEIHDLEEKVQADGAKEAAAPSDWEAQRAELQQKIERLEADLREAGAQMQKQLDSVRSELNEASRQRDEAVQNSEKANDMLDTQRKNVEQMRSENAQLEQRANDAEQKVSLLLDQVEHSVDNYRRQSRQVPSLNSELSPGTNGLGIGHTRDESSEAGSTYGANNVSDARNSAALDNLASELETLRSHWEATNKNYRLSTNFDMDPDAAGRRADDGGVGLSESLADWRKKLDTEERAANAAEKARHTETRKPRVSLLWILRCITTHRYTRRHRARF